MLSMSGLQTSVRAQVVNVETLWFTLQQTVFRLTESKCVPLLDLISFKLRQLIVPRQWKLGPEIDISDVYY